MTTATYRGVSYDVEARRFNELVHIKEQLEKAQRAHEARVQAAKA